MFDGIEKKPRLSRMCECHLKK